MFAKLNDYFGLETLSDRIYYYGVFGVGSVLLTVNIFIAFIV